MNSSIIRLNYNGSDQSKNYSGTYIWSEYRSGGKPIYYCKEKKTIILYDAIGKKWKLIKLDFNIYKQIKNENNIIINGLIESEDFKNWTKNYSLRIMSDDWTIKEELIYMESVDKIDNNSDMYWTTGVLIIIILILAIVLFSLFDGVKQDEKNKQLKMKESSVISSRNLEEATILPSQYYISAKYQSIPKNVYKF